jgi:hypothetical protein
MIDVDVLSEAAAIEGQNGNAVWDILIIEAGLSPDEAEAEATDPATWRESY